MQYKIYFVPYIGDNILEKEMNYFLRSHRIVNVTKQMVSSAEGASWSFCIEYMEDTLNVDSDKKYSKKVTIHERFLNHGYHG